MRIYIPMKNFNARKDLIASISIGCEPDFINMQCAAIRILIR